MKLYPATLLVLLLADRKYRDALWAVLLAVGLTAASVFAISVLAARAPSAVLADWAFTLFGGHSSAWGIGWAGVSHGTASGDSPPRSRGCWACRRP